MGIVLENTTLLVATTAWNQQDCSLSTIRGSGHARENFKVTGHHSPAANQASQKRRMSRDNLARMLLHEALHVDELYRSTAKSAKACNMAVLATDALQSAASSKCRPPHSAARC